MADPPDEAKRGKTGQPDPDDAGNEPELGEDGGGVAVALDDVIIFEPVADGRELLRIRRPQLELDEAAANAVAAVEDTFGEFVETAKRLIRRKKMSGAVAQVTARLNKSSLSDRERLVLGTKGVYDYLLANAVVNDQVDPEDVTGLYESVRRTLGGKPQSLFEGKLVELVLEQNQIDLTDARQLEVARRLRDAKLSLTPGAVEKTVLALVKKVGEEGDLPSLVEYWLENRSGLAPGKVTAGLKSAMVRALRPFKSEIDLQKVNNGDVDEFFVVALDKAALASEGGADPIVLTRPPASVAAWDFQVDTFESAEEQGVVPPNILAAGALDYIYVLGERLGVYKLADSLVLRWAAGTIDIEGEELSNLLYRYWKLREDRMTAEERGMVYKRVLDKGDTEVLSRMVVNEAFPSLWHGLMETTTQYIEREQQASVTTLLSRRPITLATQQLQYNLTEFATGMVHLQAAEMYAQLKDAFDLLGSEEIVSQLTGGRRRNMWAAIGALAHDEFGVVPDIGSLRTLAVEGNKVFRWIAGFQAGAFTEEDFEAFKGSAEEWIIAAASEGPDLAGEAEETEELDDDEEIAAIEREADF